MSKSIYGSRWIVRIILVSLSLFSTQQVFALTFLGGGGSGLPKTSLDGTSTGSNTLCTCDVGGANCSADLTGANFSITGTMVCKRLEDGVTPDPVTFFNSGTGTCSAAFTFSPVMATSTATSGSITLGVVAAQGNSNPNAGVTAMGTLNCGGSDSDPNLVCPTGSSCTLAFGGVTDLSNKQWQTNLPATDVLDAGQVLSVTYDPNSVSSDRVNTSQMQWRLCHDRFGEFDVPTCEGVKGNKLKTTADGKLIVQEVAGDYSPTSLNVTQPDNTTNGTMKLTLSCQENFDPMSIDPGTIKIGSVLPISESIPTTSCPGTVYTATFDRASIIAQGQDGDVPLMPNKTYNLQFNGFMTRGSDGIYIVGAPPIQTK